jgi:hypothetical protein
MTKKKWAFALFASIILLGLGAPLAGDQGITVNRDVTVAAGETQDNVFTLGGNAIIDGRVLRSVGALGGSITISGEVGEAVVGIGSRIVIRSTAVVNGDVVALGGTLEKEPGCTIRGDTVDLRGPEIGPGFIKGIFSFSLIPLILIIKLIIFFLWFMVALVGVALFPKPIERASTELRKSFWVVLAIGFLAQFVFAGLVVFAAILSIILIGIPVLLALLAAGFAIWVFGRLTLFYFFGDSLLRALGSRRISSMGAVLMGLLVVTLIGFIPVFNILFALVLNCVGWGIAIRTKFGTTENIFLKKSRATPAPPAAPAA